MKQILFLLLSFAALVTTPGCSKKSDDTPTPLVSTIPSGFKEYQVEYRVSSTSIPVARAITYINGTGASIPLTNIMLPAVYSFKRNMKKSDAVGILAEGFDTSAPTEITCAILIDGTEMKKETSKGTKAYVNIAFIIP